MSRFPYIFTFYSFKGGVGRSMALVNTAYLLAARGRKVLVLDMDLEAPGISGFLGRHEELERSSPKDILDLVAWAKDQAARHGEAILQNPGLLDPMPELADFAAPVRREKVDVEPLRPRLGQVGQIDVIAAHVDRDYFARLQGLGLAGLNRESLLLVGEVLRAYLKSRRVPIEVPAYYGPDAPREEPYDYVLIDSRTGITETGGLCLGPLADRLVVLTALNDQNVRGTRQVLDELGIRETREQVRDPWDDADVAADEPESPPRLGPKPTLVVASPVPAGEIEYKRERLRALRELLNLKRVTATLSYHPQLALIESLFVREYPEEYLAREYVGLADAIMAAARDHAAQLLRSSQEHQRQKRLVEAARDALRLAPHHTDVGGYALTESANRLVPHDEAGHRVLDAVLNVLAQLPGPERAVVYANWGLMLAKWADTTSQFDLAAVRRRAAFERFDAVLALPDVPAEQKANALLGRGVAKRDTGDPVGAIADYDAVLAMRDAPADSKARALLNRGATKGEVGDLAAGIADCDAVLALPDAPVGQKGDALFNRGIVKGQAGDRAGEIADYDAVLALPDAPAETKAAALVNRGIAKGKAGDPAGEIADYDAVLAMRDAPADSKARALLNRGAAKGKARDTAGEIADYDAVLAMPDAPTEQRASALLRRGVTKGRAGDTAGAIADYDTVLALPAAPTEQKAKALLNRGIVKGQAGDRAGEIADYDAVLGLPAAPAEQKADALFNLACVAARDGDAPRALAHLEQWRALASDATQATLDGDKDFDPVRNDPAFMRFRASLPEH